MRNEKLDFEILRHSRHPITRNPAFELRFPDKGPLEATIWATRQAGLNIWAFPGRQELSPEQARDLDKRCDYEWRVRELEEQGETRSDAQGIADMELFGLRAFENVRSKF